MKYKELNQLSRNIQAVLNTEQETKVHQKLVKIYDKIKVHADTLQKEIDILRLDNAATDERDLLILDEKGEYKFTKEGLKKLTSQVDDLSETEFEFKKIIVINPQGLEQFIFLKNWVDGVTFIEVEEVEL